jgi:hypothetical protein
MQKKSKLSNTRGKPRGRKSEGVTERVHTYDLWFHPASANVTVAGSASYSASFGDIVGPGASAVDASFAVVSSLNDLAAASEFSAMYDSYRIEHLDYELVPLCDVQPNSDDTSAATSMVAKPEFLETVIDLDDSTAPTTHSEMLQYESFRYWRPSEKGRVSFSPRVAREVFDGVTASFEEPDGPVWIDCAQPTTPHYGFKAFVGTQGSSSNVQNIWRIWGKMRISFKRVR